MDKIKTTKIILRRLLWLAIVAALLHVAYTSGKNEAEETIDRLNEEVADLQKSEYDATVVKRVSQQMEDIAYQQKAISDTQRERAEQQSALALEMRDRAEQESHLARQAQQQAQDAARLAESERLNAERQRQDAELQRDQATHAKSITDTLNYRTLARTLGSTSQTQMDAGERELSELMAYASWYFQDKYKGNTYQPETFKSLSLCTDNSIDHNMAKRGGVQAIASDGKHTVAVSNYGEIEMWKDANHRSTVILQNKDYHFVDVALIDGKIYALSQHNALLVVNTSGQNTPVALPTETYFKLLKIDAHTLLLAAERHLMWYNTQENKIQSVVNLDHTLSAIVKRNNAICLFFADGKYAEMNGSGKVTPKTPLCHGIVTYAFYDGGLGALFLGLKNGGVALINNTNRAVTTLTGHVSRVTSLVTIGDVLVSGSYDKSVLIWKLSKLQFESGLTFADEMKQKETLHRNVRSDDIVNEWLTPVNYTFSGWVLSVGCVPNSTVAWVGTSNGLVRCMNVDVNDLAHTLHAQINRNMTLQEWTHYIGSTVPYIKFK